MTYEEAIKLAPPHIGRVPCIYNKIVFVLSQKGNTLIFSPEDFDLIKDHKIREDIHGYPCCDRNVFIPKLIKKRLTNNHKVYIDHIDRNPRNNLRENLRIATFSQSACNRKLPEGQLSFTGVAPLSNSCQQLFKAYISLKKKVIHLGSFSSAEEAAHARDRAAVALHGEYAVLNFPERTNIYKQEILSGAPIIKKTYAPGQITHAMKYVTHTTPTKPSHTMYWIVKNPHDKVIGRFNTKEEAMSFRDTWYASFNSNTP